jgi:FMN phosphatase YigB (HAD superfamily)
MTFAKKVVAFDFDGTLALHDNEDYQGDDEGIRPNHAMIEQVRMHHNQYDFILIYTARPSGDRAFIESTLSKWNIPYDAVITDKPRYDVIYDDIAIGKHCPSWPK